MTTYISEISLTAVFERLDVVDAREIALEEGCLGSQAYYVARSCSKRAFVDRQLAVRLRTDGATWCGDVLRDPCAVA